MTPDLAGLLGDVERRDSPVGWRYLTGAEFAIIKQALAAGRLEEAHERNCNCQTGSIHVDSDCKALRARLRLAAGQAGAGGPYCTPCDAYHSMGHVDRTIEPVEPDERARIAKVVGRALDRLGETASYRDILTGEIRRGEFAQPASPASPAPTQGEDKP